MNASDYIVDYLIQLGVTDAFGIPGGVILDFLYALDRRTPEITPHLTYHEQGAVFAACGYAQASGRLGVAYATRGPGVTNMITGIADAYYDSIPLLVITAHASTGEKIGMRIEMDQEMDPLPMASGITKYAARVDRSENVCTELKRACGLAMSGRCGPVLLDFHTGLFQSEIDETVTTTEDDPPEKSDETEIANAMHEGLSSAKRPVLLIGDGIRQSNTVAMIGKLAEKMRIPVISSRAGQDIVPESPYYYGFIGSHGVRYSNFILSKVDLIISLGNRMSFPINSKSFRPLLEKVKTIRIDVDDNEFQRDIPNSRCYKCDLRDIIPYLVAESWSYNGANEWLSVCNILKNKLRSYDINEPISIIAKLLNNIEKDSVIVSDVGNHEFWLSHAYTYAGISNRVLYSKSFGSLGCAIGKAIGAYYATRKPVVCFAGDQGFQMNIQELQTLASNKLPICIIVLNNRSSGMIRSRQKQKYLEHFLHTTETSGYDVPDFKVVAKAYGIEYREIDQIDGEVYCSQIICPCLIEVNVNEELDIPTNLLPGKPIQRLFPDLPGLEYKRMNVL